MSTNLLSKKVIIVAIIAVGAVSAILVTSSIAQATAQQQQKMMWLDGGMPKINGSINVAKQTSNFISENVKVPFAAAAQTAQGQEADGTLLGGHLGVVQGYLVYTFLVANIGNQTGHLIVVDAGNGDVLYTSEGQPLGSFGSISGHWGRYGYGGWGGPWQGHRFGWGFWH